MTQVELEPTERAASYDLSDASAHPNQSASANKPASSSGDWPSTPSPGKPAGCGAEIITMAHVVELSTSMTLGELEDLDMSDVHSGKLCDRITEFRKLLNTGASLGVGGVAPYGETPTGALNDEGSAEAPAETLEADEGPEDTPEEAAAPTIVAVLGGAGSGKSALCARLATEVGGAYLSLNRIPEVLTELDHPLGIESAEMIADGKVLTQKMQVALYKAAIEVSDEPVYVLDGFPKTLEDLEALEQQVGPVAMAVHVATTAESLEKRLPGKDGDDWDYFENVDRELDDDAVRSRRERFYVQSGPLLGALSESGKLRTVSTMPPMDVSLAQATTMLAGIGGADCAPPAPPVVLLASELGCAYLSRESLAYDLTAAGHEAGIAAADVLAAGKVLPTEMAIELYKAAIVDQRGSPAYLMDGFPDTLGAFAAFEAGVCRVSVAVHLEVDDAALEPRLASKDGDSWDLFDDLERELDDDQLKARHARKSQQAGPLVESLKGDGRLRAVPVTDLEEAHASALRLLDGIGTPSFLAGIERELGVADEPNAVDEVADEAAAEPEAVDEAPDEAAAEPEAVAKVADEAAAEPEAVAEAPDDTIDGVAAEAVVDAAAREPED